METATNNDPAASTTNSSNTNASHLVKGKLVNVISRTWPGINKPGGIGKITKIYTEESTQLVKCVDVKYIVHGGTDKIIPIEFIEPHEDDGNRKRSNLSERCNRCKSFRSDCQSCDWRFDEIEAGQRRQREEDERRRLEEEMARNVRNKGTESNDDDEGMDSEEEEAYMAKIGKRYRKACREAKGRSTKRSTRHTNDATKKKEKKQHKGKSVEGQQEDSDSDEEKETLGALIKKKKLQRKKIKRRKQLQNPSVLASLPPSTNNNEPKESVLSKTDDGDKSAKEDAIGNNGADTAAPTSNVDDEEMEFDFTAEIDTDDDDESADGGGDDADFIENNNNYEMEDQEASGSEDSDVDVKLIELGKNTDETDLGIRDDDDEQEEIKNFINDLMKTTIPYSTAELLRLKGVLKELKRSMIKNEDDCIDELNGLAKKADALHDYVVKELIRNGVDKCNKVMRSLTKKRRTKTARMGKSERNRYNRQIEGLDLNVDTISKRIEEVDKDVTNFQKEVDKVLEEAEDYLHNYFFQSHTTTSHTVNDAQKRKRNSSEKEWNPHQHASHKRKSSSKSHVSNNKRKNRNQPWHRSSHASSVKQQTESASNTDQNEEINDDTVYVDFDISSDVEIESSEADDVAAGRYQSIDSDSIGETDELDNGPAIHDTTRSWHTSSSKSRQKDSSGVQRQRDSSRVRRGSSNKQPKQRIPTYRHIIREGRAPSRTNSVGVRSRQSQALNGTDRGGTGNNKSGTSESQRTAASQSTRNNLAGQLQASGRSSTNTSSRRERVVQNFLKPENLFSSLSASQQDNALTHEDGSHSQVHGVGPRRNHNSSTLTNNSLPLNELCTSLRESHSQELDSCRETLSALSNSVPSGNEEVETVFQSLHTLLKAKCSTLLDVVNCDPQMACFQMDCWSFVFRLLEQKFHNQLPQTDVLWKVFGNSTVVLARHILLQIVDVLYSQLMGDGYGDAPRLTDHFFSRMRSLCRQIGKVVPILPELPILISLMSGQRWYLSLINDQEIYVSMLDPKNHKRFITEGEVSKTNGTNRLDLYEGKIPRREINALWTTIGFFTDASPLPSKKKEKRLASFVQKLLQSKCGVLPSSLKSTCEPAAGIHLDRCMHEFKWVCHLLSKSMLGELPFKADFVPGIVKRAILLESNSVTLQMRPTASQEKVDRVMRQLWRSSSLGSSDQILVGLTYFDSFFTQNNIDDAWCFVPSTSLSQTCASMIELYAAASSRRTTKAYWNNFAREVDKLASTLVAKAMEADMKGESRPKSPQTNDVGTSFAHLFPELDVFSEKESVASPTGAYLRESACFSLLACIIASTQSDSFIPTTHIALNKRFREKVRVIFLSGDTDCIKSVLNNFT